MKFDLETWYIQGPGNRQKSQWKELNKVYLHLKCERVIDHGLGTMNLMPITHLTLKLGSFKFKVTDNGHDGKNSSRSIYIWSVKGLLTMV